MVRGIVIDTNVAVPLYTVVVTPVQESAQITFKPLYGADSKHEPLCFLLVVDDVTILLDCGWDERFSLDTIAPLLA